MVKATRKKSVEAFYDLQTSSTAADMSGLKLGPTHPTPCICLWLNIMPYHSKLSTLNLEITLPLEFKHTLMLLISVIYFLSLKFYKTEDKPPVSFSKNGKMLFVIANGPAHLKDSTSDTFQNNQSKVGHMYCLSLCKSPPECREQNYTLSPT